MSYYRGERRSRSRSNEDRRGRGRFEERNELRLLIRSRDAGAVIGRGGENVKKLRYDHKSNVTVTDSRTPERLVLMSGEEEGLIGILNDISSCFLEKNTKDGTSGIKRSRRERGDEEEEKDEEELELKMLIHNSQAGCVIGKSGNKLKELRRDLQCEVKVFPECCPRSSERIVLAIGPAKQICKALVHIHELLKAWPPKGVIEYYDPNCYDPEAVPDYGGYFDNDEDWGRRGNRRNRDNRDFRGGRDDYRRGGGGGGGGGGGYDRGRRFSKESTENRDEPDMMMSNKSTQKVSIPAELAGVIIGKQGSNIRKIRNETGAEVDIDDVGGGENDRIILIYGTPDQIQNAQVQLQMSVKQHLAKNA